MRSGDGKNCKLLSKLIRERVRGARVNSTSYAAILNNDRQSDNTGPQHHNNNARSDTKSNVRSHVRSGVRSGVGSDVRTAVGSGARSPMNLMRQPHALSNTMPAQSAQT